MIRLIILIFALFIAIPVHANETNQDVWNAIRATVGESHRAYALVPSPLAILKEPLYAFATQYHQGKSTNKHTSLRNVADDDLQREVSHFSADAAVFSPLVAPSLT